MPTMIDLINPRFDFRGDGVSHKEKVFKATQTCLSVAKLEIT